MRVGPGPSVGVLLVCVMREGASTSVCVPVCVANVLLNVLLVCVWGGRYVSKAKETASNRYNGFERPVHPNLNPLF